jgi:hypothetical protein
MRQRELGGLLDELLVDFDDLERLPLVPHRTDRATAIGEGDAPASR